MGYSRQGVRNHTPLALLRKIEEERRLFLWKRDGSLRVKEQKRCSFRGLAASAAATFNTPGASLAEIKRANDRMLLALSEIRPEVLPVVVPRENSQVVVLSQVERAERFRRESLERATSKNHLDYLNAKGRLEALLNTENNDFTTHKGHVRRRAIVNTCRWPLLFKTASVDFLVSYAIEVAHEANIVNGFCS